MIRTGIVRDDRFNLHRMSEDHPEHPGRLRVLYRMMDDLDMKDRFVPIPSRPASDDELLLVHSPRYINRLKKTEGKQCTQMDRDTQTCATSHEAALLAAGGLCEAVRWVCEERLNNAFAMVRPPGHHAEKGCAIGVSDLTKLETGQITQRPNCWPVHLQDYVILSCHMAHMNTAGDTLNRRLNSFI